jgi:hypothetical protein
MIFIVVVIIIVSTQKTVEIEIQAPFIASW